MSFWKGFLEWFCGKQETTTSAQFSKMMKTVSKMEEEGRKGKEEQVTFLCCIVQAVIGILLLIFVWKADLFLEE